jgi:hypothetical protein
MDVQGNTHGQWLTQHQNGIWFLQHWYQSHLVKKVAQRTSYNREPLVVQETCSRVHHSMLGIPRMSAVSVQKQFTSSVYWLGEQACPFCWPTHFFSQYRFIGLQNTHSGPFTRHVTNGWCSRHCYLSPLRLLLCAAPMEYNITLYQLLRLAVWTESNGHDLTRGTLQEELKKT